MTEQIQETTESSVLKPSIERLWVEVVPDTDPDPSYLYQTDPDFSERRAAFEAGQFAFAGVQVCAEIRFLTPQGGYENGPIVRSPGLWGIEDDSGEDYFRSVAEDELHELKNMLYALGITAAQVPLLDGTLTYR